MREKMREYDKKCSGIPVADVFIHDRALNERGISKDKIYRINEIYSEIKRETFRKKRYIPGFVLDFFIDKKSRIKRNIGYYLSIFSPTYIFLHRYATRVYKEMLTHTYNEIKDNNLELKECEDILKLAEKEHEKYVKRYLKTMKIGMIFSIAIYSISLYKSVRVLERYLEHNKKYTELLCIFKNEEDFSDKGRDRLVRIYKEVKEGSKIIINKNKKKGMCRIYEEK